MSKPKSIQAFSQAALACLMVLMYLGIQFHNSIHHSVSHSHETEVICTSETELDPCHRTIHHKDLESGCKHKTHLSNPESHCKFCDAVPVKVQLAQLQDKEGLLFSTNTWVAVKGNEEVHISPDRVILLRGPPALI